MSKTNFAKRILSLFLSLMMIVTSIPYFAITASAATEDHYLLAYFKGNDKANTSGTDQTIRFAVSTDGYNYEAIYGGNKVINQTIGTGNARDPYIFKGQDGYYYCIATDADCSSSWWGNSQTMILWRSTDLINWKDGTIINMKEKIGKDTWRCWAPEVFWNGSEYVVYFGLAAADYTDNGSGDNTHMYYCTTTDLLDQNAYSTPKLLISNANKDNIDGDIAVYNGKYYLFYKDETNATICVIRSDVAPSSSLSEAPFDYNNNVKLNAGSSVGALEGCEVFQDNSGNYIFMADRYNSNGNFAMYNLGSNLDVIYNNATTSGGVLTYNLPSQVNHNLKTSNPTGVSPRHGSVVKISADQYNALKAATEFTTTYSVNGEKLETTVANGYDENLIARYFTSSNVTSDTASGKYNLSSNGSGASWDANMYGGSGAAYFTPDNYMSSASASAMFTESKNGKTIQSNGLTVSFLGKTSSSNDANGRFFEFNKSGLKNSHIWGNTSTPSRYITLFAKNGLETEISWNREENTYRQDGSVMAGSNSSVSTVDAWHQYTLTIDGNKTTVFVDGVKAYEMLFDKTQDIIADIASSGYLLIGACCWPDNTFTGYIRDFRVYNFGARDDEAARIASEINNDYAFDQMQIAINSFETKMKSGKVYTNMKPAYDAYVALNAAYDAFNYGKDSSVDISSYVRALSTAVENMKEWSSNKAIVTGSFNQDNANDNAGYVASDYYKGLVYSGQGTTDGTESMVDAGDYRIYLRIHGGKTVALYDGTSTVRIPVMFSAKTTRDRGWNAQKLNVWCVYTNTSRFSLVNEKWYGYDINKTNFRWLIGGNGGTQIPSTDASKKKTNSQERKDDRWYYAANVLNYDVSTNPFADGVYSMNITPSFTMKGGNDGAGSNALQTVTLSSEQVANYSPSYILNYKPLLDAINNNKSKIPSNITTYKEGGLSSIIDGMSAGLNIEPSNYDYATDIDAAVKKCATDISNAVNSVNGVQSLTANADNENQYIAVRALLDNAGVIAAYNDGVNTNYTSKSFNNFVAKYEAAVSFMATLDTEKYTKGAQAETVANELQAAYDSLETVKASITFENLFSFDDFYNSSSASAKTSNGEATYNRTAKTITVTGSGDNYTDHSNLSTVYKIPVTAGHTYYLEFTADNANADAMIFVPNEDETGFDSAYTGFRGGHVNGHNRLPITVPDGKKYVFFRFGSTKADNVTVNFSNIVFYDSEREAERGNLTDLGVTEISVTPGQPYGELPTPTREGYTFGGWFTDTSFTKQITAETTAVNDQYATVLYAKWIVCTHTDTRVDGYVAPTCTTDGNTGTTICNTCGVTVKKAIVISALGHNYVADKATNRFVCQNDSNHIKMDGNSEIDLSAYYSKVDLANYELSNTAKYTEASLTALQQAIENNQLAPATDSQSTVDAKAQAIGTAITNLKLRTYAVKLYVLADNDDDTSDNNPSYSQEHQYGDVVNLTVKEDVSPYKWTREGYDLRIANATNEVSVVVNGDTVVYAYYSDTTQTPANQYRVTFYNKLGKAVNYLYVNEGTALTLNGSTITADNGQTYSYEKVPFYQIVGYKAGSTEISGTTYTVNGDVNLYPIYSAQNEIKITLDKSGQNINFIDDSVATEKIATWDQKITVVSDTDVIWYANNVAVAKGKSYTFRASSSITVRAELSAEEKGSSTITYSNYDDENNKVRYAVSSYQSDKFVIKEQGIIVGTSTKINATFAKDVIIKNGKKFVASKTTDTGDQFSYSISLGSSASTIKTICAVSYVTYENDSTEYSDIVYIYKN